jgi:hypothetical protein
MPGLYLPFALADFRQHPFLIGHVRFASIRN